jgi:hypothetical protein
MTVSTTYQPKAPQGILPPVGQRKAVFRAVFNRAHEAFGDGIGLTCIDKDRAFFQVIGDPTFYSIAITVDEAVALGYVLPAARE